MRRPQQGFTLIEVLIVLVVMSLILLLLGEATRLGLRAIDSFAAKVSRQGNVEPVEHALRQMIERMDPGHYPDPPALQGSAHEFSFTTELPELSAGGPLLADVRLTQGDGELLLWWTPHTGGIPFGRPQAARRTVLLAPVAGLEIAYAAKGAGASWQPAWTAPALPGMVRLRLRSPAGRADWPAIIARPLRETAEE